MKSNNIQNNELGEKKHAGFASKLGFLLAASGSAVGLGNLWRFPYLTATYGGGIFILTYILLAIFFGICLLMLELAIGRYTGKSVIGAFTSLNKKFKWIGYVSIIVPILIVPYYCVIGGWVLKYGFSFLIGSGGLLGVTDTSNFFGSFISNPIEPLIFFLIFAFCTILIVAFGVQKGIEKVSKILMPTLAILSVALMIYVVFQDGALKGWAYTLVPNFANFSFKTVLGALGQMFYSMSIGMCIMITYGSYMKKKDSIKSSSIQIAIFDSAFAIVASLIIIPAVFAFSSEPYSILSNDGPRLMFIHLSNIFNSIPGGNIIAVIFFLLVFFAAVTSSVSLAEAIVSTMCESGKMKRTTACGIVFAIILVIGSICSLGYGVFSGFNFLGKDILDTFDLLSNYILLPIVAILTCVFAGWFIDKKIIPKEIGIDKHKTLRNYFNILIKYVAPIIILIILVFGLLSQFNIIKI